ncbi:MAG: hypothetical protein ABF479_10540 [Gluconacetobacter sp.]
MFEMIPSKVRSARTRLRRLVADAEGPFKESNIRRQRRTLSAPLLIAVTALSIVMAGRAMQVSTFGHDLALRYQETVVAEDTRCVTGAYAVREAIQAIESVLVAVIYDTDPAVDDSIGKDIGEPLSVRKPSP